MDDATAAGRAFEPSWRSPRGLGRRLTGAFDLPLHQLRRALREPARLRRLHWSSVRASLRAVVEPDPCRFLCDLFGIGVPAFRRLEADLVGDTDFVRTIETRHRAVRGSALGLLGRVAAEDHDRGHRLLYYVTRLVRPSIAVETGVFDGFSSAFILKALRDAGHGRLCSVDLPARTPARASTDKMAFDRLPTGLDPGWIVPGALRARWTLRLGDSRAVLAPWLATLGPIDLFFHDSLHTDAHMTWEFETAWRSLRPGGLLVSDDVFWSAAFRRFSRATGGGGRILRGMGFLRKAGAPS
jgi:predicted O-methyltransferase YrrM